MISVLNAVISYFGIIVSDGDVNSVSSLPDSTNEKVTTPLNFSATFISIQAFLIFYIALLCVVLICNVKSLYVLRKLLVLQ